MQQIKGAIFALFALIFGTLAQAQEATIDYDAWIGVAERAEEAIQSKRASNDAFETLRAQVVEWRGQFSDAQSANQARITTLKEQITALGTPEDGQAETAEITFRRNDLNAELAVLSAPALRAEEAYTQADGIITEIDSIIRERQADRLLSIGGTPLNVALWPTAMSEFTAYFRGIKTEVLDAWNNPLQRKIFVENLPLTIVSLVIAALLLGRGRLWIRRLRLRIHAKTQSRQGAYEFLISLGKIILPLLGLIALMVAGWTTNLLGAHGEDFSLVLPIAAGYVYVFWWLADRLFSRIGDTSLLSADVVDHSDARFYTLMLAVAYALNFIVMNVADYEQIATEHRAILSFPALLIAAFALYRLGLILARFVPPMQEDDPTHDIGFRYRVLRLAGQLVVVVAITGPVLALIGYYSASQALVFPAILTLALLGVLLIIQGFIGDTYGVVSGQSDHARDGLVPILMGFALSLAAMPILALIWGARVADLTELWTRFREGFVIGDTRISPTDFLTFAIVFTLGYMATKLIQGALRSSVLPKTKIDPGGQNAIVSGIGYVGVFLAAVVAISVAGIDLSSLAIVAGALSVGIGFGLQNIVQNFVSGIILLIERPVSEGDWIEVGGAQGIVRDISVRSTRIETFDRNDIIVPNADLVSGHVKNWTRGKTSGRLIVPVGVAYGNDTRKVSEVLIEIAQNHPMVLANPAPYVVFQGFGADSMDFEIRAILRDINWSLSVKTEFNHQIAEKFAEHGIEIPFAQRDIWLRNPEALRPDYEGPA